MKGCGLLGRSDLCESCYAGVPLRPTFVIRPQLTFPYILVEKICFLSLTPLPKIRKAPSVSYDWQRTREVERTSVRYRGIVLSGMTLVFVYLTSKLLFSSGGRLCMCSLLFTISCSARTAAGTVHRVKYFSNSL